MSKLPADTVENRAAWLSQACIRIMRMPKELPPNPGVERLTLTLLRSIEADAIPVPSCCVTNRGSIRLEWRNGNRDLVIFVKDAGTFAAVRVHCADRKPVEVTTRDHVESLRRLVAWLCPGVNQGTVQMVAGWRPGE